MTFTKKNIAFIAIYVLSFLTINAQEVTPKTTSLNEGSIEDQFNYISRISGNYKDGIKRYEVINLAYFNKLKSNILDSINTLENQIKTANTTINEQKQANLSLQKELDNTKIALEKTNSEKDKISLFGIMLNKTFYNLLLWSIIGLLFVLLFFFIFKFKSSNTVTKQAKKSLEDLEVEFEDHRRVALEREQKVRRQLQDEINKHKTNNL